MPQTFNNPGAGRLLVVLCVAIGGAYALYDRHQFRTAVDAREQQRVQRVEADKASAAAARAEQQRRAAERRAGEEARRAAMTPQQKREEALKEQFSGWNGSHRTAEAAIQTLMHSPRSYEHVATTYVDRGPGRGITVHTRFRGTNAFNAVISNRATVEVDEAGRVTSVKIDR